MTDAATGAAPPPPDRRRGLRWGLALSVVLNLLLLGLIAGGLARGHAERSGGVEPALGPLAAALTPADREALREEFQSRGQGWRAYRAAAAEEARALAAIIAAEPFDRAAAEAVLARQGAAVGERIRMAQAVLLDRIAALSPVERQAFAVRLQAALERGRGEGR